MRVTDKYVFFWGGTFSQWNIDTDNDGYQFIDDGIKYNCTEQYMMSKKAQLFGDFEIQQQILNTQDPSTQRKLGRQVKNFNQDIWNENRNEIVYKANFLKFSQNETLRNILFQYEGKEFVEASPVDKIWGVGLAYKNDLILDKQNWQGTNLLGIAINRVLEELICISPNKEFKEEFSFIDLMDKNIIFTKDEYEIIKNGFLAKEMEDKWNVHFAEDEFYFIRSWNEYSVSYMAYFKPIGKDFQNKFQLCEIAISTDLLENKKTDSVYESSVCIYLILKLLLKRKDVDYPINPNYSHDKTQYTIEAWANVGQIAFDK
jgi:ribA/ribD-fused uncharacterized protein